MKSAPKSASKASKTEAKSAPNLSHILIFTDGACSGNPGPGGWAAIVATPDGKVKELGGHWEHTTNNVMELMATIEALKYIRKIEVPVTFYTDSTYVIRGITQWIWGWKKKGWKNAEGQDVANKEIWNDLSRLVQARGASGKIDWHYSRGHVGTPGNERCDEIAVAFSQRKWIELFEGSLLKYSVAIYDVPEDSTLPEMKPKLEKKIAYSYLSNLGGIVHRHKDWPSCERRVKGRSGALFKKAMSVEDEAQILNGWDLSAAKVIDS